jgi:hypothetical protein
VRTGRAARVCVCVCVNLHAPLASISQVTLRLRVATNKKRTLPARVAFGASCVQGQLYNRDTTACLQRAHWHLELAHVLYACAMVRPIHCICEKTAHIGTSLVAARWVIASDTVQPDMIG